MTLTRDDRLTQQLANERASAAAYEALTPMEKLQIEADLRREDIARHELRLKHALPGYRSYHAEMLAEARVDLAKTEALIAAMCELRDRLARPDAVAARRMAA
jgi:hypothetical protein